MLTMQVACHASTRGLGPAANATFLIPDFRGPGRQPLGQGCLQCGQYKQIKIHTEFGQFGMETKT